MGERLAEPHTTSIKETELAEPLKGPPVKVNIDPKKIQVTGKAKITADPPYKVEKKG